MHQPTLLVRGVKEALAEMPAMNDSYVEVDGLPGALRPPHVNLGLAIDLPKPDGAFDLILWNEAGELTECSFGNLALQIDGQWLTPPLAAGLLLLTGFAAGLYPAFVLSSFRPVTTLRGGLARGRSGLVLRTVLVVVQFSISSALIVGTLFMQEQRNPVDGVGIDGADDSLFADIGE